MEGGADAREYWCAKTDRGGATGSWRKDGAGGHLTVSQEVQDIVAFTAR
jgi:hypothetical protein